MRSPLVEVMSRSREAGAGCVDGVLRHFVVCISMTAAGVRRVTRKGEALELCATAGHNVASRESGGFAECRSRLRSIPRLFLKSTIVRSIHPYGRARSPKLMSILNVHFQLFFSLRPIHFSRWPISIRLGMRANCSDLCMNSLLIFPESSRQWQCPSACPSVCWSVWMAVA